MNTVADFLSHLVSDSNEKLIVRSSEEVSTQPNEVNFESLGIVQENQVFFQTDDVEMQSEEQLCQRKQEKRNVVHTERHRLKKISNKSQIHSLLSNKKTHHIQRQNPNILHRRYSRDAAGISHLQMFSLGHLKDTLLTSLYGQAGKHPGISKMMQEIRQKYYFPSNANHVHKWVTECEICVQDKKKVDNAQITPELRSIPESDSGPEDVMPLDLLPELRPSRGYEKIITAIVVSSKYAFTYPLSNPTVVSRANVLLNTMTRHACLPTLLIADKG